MHLPPADSRRLIPSSCFLNVPGQWLKPLEVPPMGQGRRPEALLLRQASHSGAGFFRRAP